MCVSVIVITSTLRYNMTYKNNIKMIETVSFIEAVVLKGVLIPNMIVPTIGNSARLSINLISFVCTRPKKISGDSQYDCFLRC